SAPPPVWAEALPTRIRRCKGPMRSALLPLRQEAPVYGDETGSDQRHAAELEEFQPFAQENRSQQDGTDRDDEGDEGSVGGTGGCDDAEIDNIGEGGRKQCKCKDTRPHGRTRRKQAGRPVENEYQRYHDDGGRGELAGRYDRWRHAAEAAGEKEGEGVGDAGADQSELRPDRTAEPCHHTRADH